jgi:hypothetical protein
MKTLLCAAIVSIVALSSPFAAAPALADPAGDYTPRSAAAPADEYFGPLRMSVLGIRNSLARTTQRIEADGYGFDGETKSVALVEQAVREWEAKYPRDSWLPRTVLALHTAYREIATDESLKRSIDTASWLIDRYPWSEEAGQAREELANNTEAPGELSPTPAVYLVPPPPLPPYAHY